MSATWYVKVWKAKDGWRWFEMKSSDKVSESGEAYSSFEDAYEAASKHAPEGVDIIVEPNVEHDDAA